MSNSTAKAADMEDFFRTVGEVSSIIKIISSQAEEIERKHTCILSSSNGNKESKEELELLSNEARKNANLVQTKLKLLQKNCPSDENKTNSVIYRIQKNQHSHLTRWFSEVMKNYHKVQISFREKCKEQIQRQLEIVDKVTTDEELEDMLQCDNLAIFISNVHSNAHTSRALTEIERRHHDIISLEYGIKELHEIVTETAILLEIQGELINNIEKNVTSAAEYITISKEETNRAVEYKKNPYKIVSLPSFLKSFRRQASTKTAVDKNF